METEKKQWTKPELIVLVRSKPEEAVLSACKRAGGSGADVVQVGCVDQLMGTCFSNCSDIVQS
jgi:hypothetical protein